MKAGSQRGDIAVHRDGPGASKLSLTEPAALDGYARQTSSGRSSNVPRAVADNVRCALVAVAAMHRREKISGSGVA